MKNSLLLFLLVCSLTSFAQQNTSDTKQTQIFKVVENMPSFPGCEQQTNKAAKNKCASEEMLKFIYGNLKYPQMAREKHIEGMVILNMVVETDGRITNVKVSRYIGGGCDEEAVRILESMPKWNPGTQRGVPVRVSYNIPIRFKLENQGPRGKGKNMLYTNPTTEPFLSVCGPRSNKHDRNYCNDSTLVEYIYSNLKYPEAAKTNKTEGVVVLRAVVERNGQLTNIEVIREIGDGCGEEAVRILSSMPPWTAGQVKGQYVRVERKFFVEFNLDGSRPAVKKSKPRPSGKIYERVDEPAIFKGCDQIATPKEQYNCSKSALKKYLKDNLQYPPKAAEKGLYGKVVYRVVIEVDGSIGQRKIIHSDNKELNRGNSKLFFQMPRWKPAKVKGKPVRSYHKIELDYSNKE